MPIRTQKENDKLLRDDVLLQLEWDPRLISTNISVSATDKVVTLNGFVRTYAEKFAAGKAAQGVYGVEAVANDLEVKPVNTRLDAEIAHDILHAMKIDVTVPDDKVKVNVADGFVTLEGTVAWDFQRRVAETCARNVSGVRGVLNSVRIRPAVSAAQVSTKIEEALRRSAEVDARRITVSATDSTVHLYGRVRSSFERDEAERAAWAAPGVSEVIDHISVVP